MELFAKMLQLAITAPIRSEHNPCASRPNHLGQSLRQLGLDPAAQADRLTRTKPGAIEDAIHIEGE